MFALLLYHIDIDDDTDACGLHLFESSCIEQIKVSWTI